MNVSNLITKRHEEGDFKQINNNNKGRVQKQFSGFT